MQKKWILISALCLMLFSLASGYDIPKEQPSKTEAKIQTKQENPALKITAALLDLLAKNFQVKKIVGDPVKVGNVTIIPIIMIDVGYGGGGGGLVGQNQMGGSGFGMSGQARPLGFVIISKSGTKFLSAGKAPRE
jgi:uncharacterized spore protein YtfJ